MAPNDDGGEQSSVAAGERTKSPQINNKIEPFREMVASDLRQNKRLSPVELKSNGYQATIPQPANSKPNGSSTNSKTTRIRFLIATLGLISLSMSQMSRMVLNVSITQMVEQPESSRLSDQNQALKSSDGSCPWPKETIIINDDDAALSADDGAKSTTTTTPANSQDVDQNLDDLCGDLLDDTNISKAPPSPRLVITTTTSKPQVVAADITNSSTTPTTAKRHQAERFKWNIKQQSVLLGGFYYSYFVFMVLGGRMAEIYGAKYVLLLGVSGSAVINLATPWMARTSFELLVMSRVLMGAIQSGVFPGMYALIAKWLTMSEASIYTPLIKMNLRLGMVLGSMVPGLVDSWSNVFYLTGALNALWSIVWIIVANSNPAESRWVSEAELKHIQRKKRTVATINNADGTTKRKKAQKTPWLQLLTAPSVIGLIIVKLTFNYALDFLAIELPSYLRYVHHASKETISAITSFMFSIQVFLIVFVGWLAKVMIQRRPFKMSKTAIRKLFQGVASVGMALALFALTFNDCNLVYVSVLLQIVSLLSMFTAGGETMLPYDLSEEYPATIMAIANSIANVSAITTTTLTGLILGDQSGSYDRWNILIYIIVGANLFGGSMFIILVKAEPIESLIDWQQQQDGGDKQRHRKSSKSKRGLDFGIDLEDKSSHVNDGFDDIELSSINNSVSTGIVVNSMDGGGGGGGEAIASTQQQQRTEDDEIMNPPPPTSKH